MSWSDTDFVNINAGGDYSTWGAFGSDTWDTFVPGQITEHYGFGGMQSVRNDAAATKNQRVKIAVTELHSDWYVFVRAGAVAQGTNGYSAVFHATASEIYWYSGDTFGGNPPVVVPSGAGTVELVCIDDVCRVYVNDALISTRDMGGTALTTDDARQGFGYGGNLGSVLYAEGGDVGGAKVTVLTSRATRWNVASALVPVGPVTRATRWNVAGTTISVSTARATRWTTRAGVAVTRATTWNVAGTRVAVATSRATRWVVRARVAISRTTRWDVEPTGPTVPTQPWLALHPDTVMYLGTRRIVALYQGTTKVWP